jgi:hypothetical protein
MFPTESACSSDCGKALPCGFSSGKTTTVEIPSKKNQPVRHYNVHLPTDYQNNREHAIVFSFHGRSRDMYTGPVHFSDNQFADAVLPTDCFADRYFLPTGSFCRQKFEVKKS